MKPDICRRASLRVRLLNRGKLKEKASMYCPSCGTESNDQTKYCTKCGVNLRRVKGVLGKGGAGVGEGNDREPGFQKRAQQALLEAQRARIEDRLEERRSHRNEWRKKTPEEKRLNEIKA